MPQVVALEDVRHRSNRTRGRLRTDFFYTPDKPRAPMAYLHQGDPGRVTPVHWHANDQFQVAVEGEGTLGRNRLHPYTAQFVRAYTPYGPIVGSEASGVSYISLLTRYDPNANYLPETREALLRVPDRRPWQVIRQLDFSQERARLADRAVDLQAIPGIRDDRGLQAWTLVMAPNAKVTTPDPAGSEGQFVLVLKGSLVHEARDHSAFSVVFVEPESGSFPLQAGAAGMEAVVVNFPTGL